MSVSILFPPYLFDVRWPLISIDFLFRSSLFSRCSLRSCFLLIRVYFVIRNSLKLVGLLHRYFVHTTCFNVHSHGFGQ
ncbi:hypothetical protein M408DRAFT_30010 [Serendipita vermifera MAFF 305830]|uniref:Uncharacterized protein n=1 Tax=Serendipita vermifera MAFF 305830 TaxID=933852 RepID=A0A0C3ANL6_SERVB|nr:hypothetical protein M408DRAFT_30010 [Serendipita vermifera MAFF 305830]